MAKVRHHLANQIVKDHFGELVVQISSYLIKNGRRGLRDICNAVPFTKEEAKKSLSILIQHHLIRAHTSNKGQVEYEVLLDNILIRKRFSRYVYCAKAKAGDIAELIIESLLLSGSDIISRASKKVAERLETDEEDGEKADERLVVQKFIELINARYLKRVQDPNAEEAEVEDVKEMFKIPTEIGVKRKATASGSSEPQSKKSKQSEVSSGEDYADEGIYWHVNFEKFDEVFMDQLIIDAVTEQVDQSAARIVATMLKLDTSRELNSGYTQKCSMYDIKKKLPNIPKIEMNEIDQYLGLLADEKTGGFVSKVDSNSGGMYSVNMERSMEIICHSACAQVVQERFGSKACRVFRLLYMKKHLEQKQVGELAMIPFKEVKELLYKLFEERFVKIQEISKQSDYAPSRTFYLFSVDLPQVARLLLNRCYQAIGNMMTRRESEMVENKRLLEKNEKLEGILAALGNTNEDTEQVIQELEELITPSEKQQLEKLKIDLTRLEQGEIQVEETVAILQNYLRFH